MSYTDMRSAPLPHPDPVHDAEFYDSVPLKRFLAWLADVCVIALISVLVVPFTAFTGLFFFPLLMMVVGFAYRTLTIAGGSATWGMRLMAIELRGEDGQRLDLGGALLHTAGYAVSISMMPLQLVSAVLMLASAKRQGLTDHVMGSVMVNRSAR